MPILMVVRKLIEDIEDNDLQKELLIFEFTSYERRLRELTVKNRVLTKLNTKLVEESKIKEESAARVLFELRIELTIASQTIKEMRKYMPIETL